MSYIDHCTDPKKNTFLSKMISLHVTECFKWSQPDPNGKPDTQKSVFAYTGGKNLFIDEFRVYLPTELSEIILGYFGDEQATPWYTGTHEEMGEAACKILNDSESLLHREVSNLFSYIIIDRCAPAFHVKDSVDNAAQMGARLVPNAKPISAKQIYALARYTEDNYDEARSRSRVPNPAFNAIVTEKLRILAFKHIDCLLTEQ